MRLTSFRLSAMRAELRVHVQRAAQLQGLLVAAGPQDVPSAEAGLSDHVSQSVP